MSNHRATEEAEAVNLLIKPIFFWANQSSQEEKLAFYFGNAF